MSETTSPARSRGAEVARAFGEAAAYYDAHADVQRNAAGRLLQMLEPVIDDLPEGPVLDVGCGTGFLSRHLARILAGRELEITDLSGEMIAFCRRALGAEGRGAIFRRVDGEHLSLGGRAPALITAGFVAQWFADPAEGLARLYDRLTPGGVLAASVPVEGSFPEWRQACELTGVPFTAGPLPAAAVVGERIASRETVALSVIEESATEVHAGPREFLRHLKRIGASARPRGGPRLAPTELSRLVKAWERVAEGETRITYRVLYLVCRCGSPGDP